MLSPMEGKETGFVSSYHPGNSYGFITQDSGGDLFVYGENVGRVNEPGYLTLIKGERVKFDIGEGPDGRPMAVNVTILDRLAARQEAGLIASFDMGAGFGRIISDVGGTEVVFHKTAIISGSWRRWESVPLGARVEYKATRRPDGVMQAFHVTGCHGHPLYETNSRQPTGFGHPENCGEGYAPFIQGSSYEYVPPIQGSSQGHAPPIHTLPRDLAGCVIHGHLQNVYGIAYVRPPVQGYEDYQGALLPYFVGFPSQEHQGYHGAAFPPAHGPAPQGYQGDQRALLPPAHGPAPQGYQRDQRALLPPGPGPHTQGYQGDYEAALPPAYGPHIQGYQGDHGALLPQPYGLPKGGTHGGHFGGNPSPQACRPPAQRPQVLYPAGSVVPQAYRPPSVGLQGRNLERPPLPQPYQLPTQATQGRNIAGGMLPEPDGPPRQGPPSQERALAGDPMPQPDGPAIQEAQGGNLPGEPTPHVE